MGNGPLAGGARGRAGVVGSNGGNGTTGSSSRDGAGGGGGGGYGGGGGGGAAIRQNGTLTRPSGGGGGGGGNFPAPGITEDATGGLSNVISEVGVRGGGRNSIMGQVTISYPAEPVAFVDQEPFLTLVDAVAFLRANPVAGGSLLEIVEGNYDVDLDLEGLKVTVRIIGVGN